MRQIRFNPVNTQVTGLSGRRTRSPLVKKYAEKVASLRPRREIVQPTLAPPLPESPSVKRVPFEGGPGIGPGEGAVGGIETGSTFGETKGEQAVMNAMNPYGTMADLFGLSLARGGKTGYSLASTGS